MKKVENAKSNFGLWLGFIGVGIIAILLIIPGQFRSQAGGKEKIKGYTKTESLDQGIPKMWDIREQKESYETLTNFRSRIGKNAVEVADIRQKFVDGEETFKRRFPTAKIEYNTDIRIPEVITPDVYRPTFEFLSEPSNAKRTDILRGFIKQNNDLVGLTNFQIDNLKTAADYTNPDGELSFVHFDQEINGIPVFRGEVKAGFNKNNQIIRVINNLAPGLEYGNLSSDFRDPLDAVKVASTHIKHQLTTSDVTLNGAASNNLKTVFGEGDWATTAEKMYFPTEPGVAVPSWRVLIWRPVNAYYVIVDAESGVVLWHKNITDDQTQAATYQVYGNPTSYIDTADSVAPLSPGLTDPSLGTQGVAGTRTNRTLIGNEGTLSFNNNGWITDGGNILDGNATEAGVDVDGTNGVDAATIPVGSPTRTFTSLWNPPLANDGTGDLPSAAEARRGAVIQMFYIMNRYHDELYKRGFTEAARNFQASNFGRGGLEADRVSSEGQDSSGTNNANFSTPADGGRGRMQMFVWTGPNPDRDGTADADIVIHEVTHGLSNRLHGNGSGLGNQGGMMGEGWGDWYGHTMLAEPTDPINGTYSVGGYNLFQLAAGFSANYYYGIRRFPTAVIAYTGGPNNRPHNPLTFGHLNTGCDTTLGTSTTAVSSAFPRSSVIATSGNCSQVHNAGEIWKSALWEVRALFVSRLGFATGTTKVLDVVTNGMKLAPLNPMMLQERDAIIAAASADPACVLDIREGFRRRGMGFSASTQSATAVTESFDAADITANTAGVTSGNNLLEPNECNTVNVPLTNNSPNLATGITAVLSTTTPGITVTQPNSAYPDLAGGAGPVNNTTPFQVSVDNSVACYTNATFTLTVTYTGGGGGSPEPFNFSLPVGLPSTNYNFTSGASTIPAGGTLIAGSTSDDAAVTVPMPSGWASTIYGVPVTSLSASTNGMLTANGAAATTFTNTALPGAVGGTNPTLFPYWDDYDMDPADTVGGGIYVNTIGSAPNRQLYVEWRATHFSETTTAISTNFAVLLTEGSDTVRYIYASTGLGAQLNGLSGTVGIQKASTGTAFTQFSFNTASLSAGLELTAVRPAGVCTAGTGACSVVAADPRSDFDGDGRTDLSVFRPSEGNWYLNRSTAGFTVVKFGISTDVITPSDFDGDNKADEAVFRVSPTLGVPDFLVLNSATNTISGVEWGTTGDVPVTADYDADNKDDFAVWRSSTGDFWVLQSATGSLRHYHFGATGDKPVPADYNGDNRTDFAVYRSGTWYIADNVTNAVTTTSWGVATDIPVFADYDGDGKDDVAVFRPSDGTWYIQKSTGGNSYIPFGANGDIPVPGDYDGDGKYDPAVYRGGTWYVNNSTSGVTIQAFGLATDQPTPRWYIPQ